MGGVGRGRCDGVVGALARSSGLARPNVVEFPPRGLYGAHVLSTAHLPLVPAVVRRLAVGGGCVVASRSRRAPGRLLWRGRHEQTDDLRTALAVGASPSAQGVARAAVGASGAGRALVVCNRLVVARAPKQKGSCRRTMPTMTDALLTVAKRPAPGQTKTRLTPPLTPQQA
ncbi:MAG: hypothetical protein KJZ93_21570, partial [Caldilineaceae bacterium]|nr:hypothetical protein [Caldilineaceae bacterium]